MSRQGNVLEQTSVRLGMAGKPAFLFPIHHHERGDKT